VSRCIVSVAIVAGTNNVQFGPVVIAVRTLTMAPPTASFVSIEVYIVSGAGSSIFADTSAAPRPATSHSA
jgi:hypothetical protein